MRKNIIILVILLLCLEIFAGTSLYAATSAQGTPTGAFHISNLNDIGKMISTRGHFITFLAVFFAGVLLSFTPCVFPMIPITLAVIGAKGIGNPARGFFLSLIYVLGIAVTYSALGFIAASTGSVFGSVMQSHFILWIVVLVFFALSLSMFGLFELQIPSSFASRFSRVGEGKRRGFIDAFLIGIVAGIVASPCISPVIAGLLAYVVKSGNQLLGTFLFFTLALGLGLLFIVLGTFPGLLASLPKPGEWLVEIKKFLGLFLLGTTFYYIKFLISYNLFLISSSITLIFLGVFAGAFYRIEHSAHTVTKIKKALGLIFVIIGATILFIITSTIVSTPVKSENILSVPSISNSTSTMPSTQQSQAVGVIPQGQPKQQEDTIIWVSSEKDGLKLAKEQHKPVILDFYTDWCGACKELDKITYVDKEVIKESKRFVMIKVNNTEDNKENQDIIKRYNLQGYPTIVFINSTGNTAENITQVGFIEPKPFLEMMKNVK